MNGGEFYIAKKVGAGAMHIVAVKKGTKSLARIQDYLVFEPSKVYRVQPGFVSVNALRKCRTIAEVGELCDRFAVPIEAVAIVGEGECVVISDQLLSVGVVYKTKLKDGICPICESPLEEMVCLRSQVNWATATNEEIAKAALGHYRGEH